MPRVSTIGKLTPENTLEGNIITLDVIPFLFIAIFLIPKFLGPPFPPTLRKGDAAYDYLKYWITVKGFST